MKKYYESSFPGTKAYFSEADRSAQGIYNIGTDEFDLKAKLWLLLYEHVIISAGHMLESPLTYNWLTESVRDVGLLAGKGSILLSLREDREDLPDFVKRRAETERDPRGEELGAEVHMERARALGDIFEKAITWSPQSESTWFRDSLVADLKRPDSPVRRKLVGVSKKDVQALCQRLGEVEFLTRKSFLSMAKDHCPRYRRILGRYADIFYHLSGALEKKAYPLLHYDEASLCREKLSDETSQVGGVKTPELWHEILSSWEITAGILKSVPLSRIREIREDSLGKRVRNTWSKVVRNASTSRRVENVLGDHLEVRRSLVKEFAKEAKRQREVYERRRRYRSGLEIGVWATGGLSTILGTVVAGPVGTIVGAGAGIVGFVTGGKILDQVEKRLPDTELVLIGARIKELGDH